MPHDREGGGEETEGVYDMLRNGWTSAGHATDVLTDVLARREEEGYGECISRDKVKIRVLNYLLD